TALDDNKEKIDILKRISKFAIVTLGVDFSRLNFSQEEIKAIHKLVLAGSINDRNENGQLFLKPYSQEYIECLIPLSKFLKEAVDDPSFYVTVGPYEVYTESSALVEGFAAHMQDIEDIENNLPVPDEYKNKDLKTPKIIVVNYHLSLEILVG
ncbi:2526_t:CDS:2, partial [Racocetra fulgida]